MKALGAAFLALVAVTSLAQQHPNAERGLAPSAVFEQLGEFDTVNLFNGNLTGSIPLSQVYRVGPNLSYQFVLRYAGNVWDYEEECYPDWDGTVCYTQAIPDRRSSAGLGWRLSMGRLVPPGDVTNETAVNSFEPGLWVYESPDGNDHVFYPTLHEEAPGSGVWYTRDATYLRLRAVAGNYYEVDFPDGTTHRFQSDGTLVEMRDRTGNYVRHSYIWGYEGLVEWLVTEGNTAQGDRRTHRVGYQVPVNCTCGGDVMTCYYGGQLPSSVDLASYNGQRTIWSLSYNSTCVGRGYNHNDPYVATTARVHLLTEARVTQPAGLGVAYRMTQDAAVQSYITSGSTTGLLQRLELPTGGRLEWSFALAGFNPGSAVGKPHRQFVPSVTQRRLMSPTSQIEGTWNYEHQPAALVTCSASNTAPSGPRYVTKTVTDPAGHKTKYYFSTFAESDLVCDNAEQWTPYEYGLPLTRHVAGVGGRQLSTQVLQGGTSLTRSSYVLYERDATGGSSSYLARRYSDANQRLKATRTVFHDDGGRYAEDEYSNFDGLGQYRTATSSGDFSSGNNRTSTTMFNPSSGSYPGSFVLPSASGPWILRSFTRREETEGASRTKSTYCFDANTGFLARRRIFAGASEGSIDLVSRYSADPSTGELIREEYFGGDVQPLGTSWDLCSLSLPSPQYRIDHEYQFGQLRSSRYVDASGIPLTFYALDQDNDQNTGLPLRSRDTSGITTSYEYNGLSRLTLVRPEASQGGVTRYVYTAATPTTRASLDVEQLDNSMSTVLGQRKEFFDWFGRPWKEKVLFPGPAGSAWSTKETTRNALGWVTGVSATEAADPPANWTLFLDFDAFGRAGRIRPPDADAGTGRHVTTISRQGVRVLTRTSTVRTGGIGGALTETPASVTEEYDRRGRLWRVIEPSGPNGESVTTTYTYDAGDRLTRVEMAGPEGMQTRQFTYDGRGLLLSETHPELGASGNGTVFYREYDARGHARRRQGGVAGGPFDLRYSFDAAERVTQIAEQASGSILKSFSYATQNASSTDRSRGKLQEAVRHNYIPWRGISRSVAERYVYGGAGGRVSERYTTISENGVVERRWAIGVTWNDLGLVARQTYPIQTFPNYYFGRSVDYTYTSGLLTGVSSIGTQIASISYHANGLVSSATLGGGSVWTQANDPQQMARPRSISSQAWASGNYLYDGAGNVATIGANSYLYDAASRLRTGYVGTQQKNYAYDSFGNRTFAGIYAGGAYSWYRYYYPGMTNRLTTGASYDEAGNQTLDGTSSFAFDSFNNLNAVSDPSQLRYTGYIYSADDERVGSYDAYSDSWTWTLRDLNSQVLSEFTRTGWRKDYIYRNGTLAAAYLAGGTWHLFTVDHLGTPRQITDWFGNPITSHDYQAFGEELTNPSLDGEAHKFTGHERDFCCSTGNNYDYMHARHYAPELGRFLSVDPSMDLKMNLPYPERWNRYSYVSNNPISKIDPDGRDEYAMEQRLTGISDDWSRDREVASFGLSAMPLGIGDAFDTISAITGRDFVSGTSVGTFARAAGLLPFVSTGTVNRIVKAVNLPAWKSVGIDMAHIIDRHTPGGAKTSEAANKFVGMTDKQIERTVREAYRYGEKVATQGDRVLVRGKSGGMVIEMWLNKKTKTIETAYPLPK